MIITECFWLQYQLNIEIPNSHASKMDLTISVRPCSIALRKFSEIFSSIFCKKYKNRVAVCSYFAHTITYR